MFSVSKAEELKLHVMEEEEEGGGGGGQQASCVVAEQADKYWLVLMNIIHYYAIDFTRRV